MTPDERPAAPARRVHSRTAAFLLSIILADREARSATFGLENPLATRFWTAVKTGTSKEMRDNWCVGFSRRYTVGVWVGNFSGAPMHDVSGVSGAAPAWLEIMEWLHRELPSPAPEPPAEVVAVSMTQNVSEAGRAECFLAGTEPTAPASRAPVAQPRILAPVAGTVIALDPDIPRGQQRVAFEAHIGSATRAQWVLDGKRFGSARKLRLWAPQPGSHTLVLVDERQAPLGTVAFSVRGSAGRVARP